MKELLQQCLTKFEHLWEIGIDAEYKVDLMPEIHALREQLAKPPIDLTDEDIGDAYVAWDNTDGASFADFARLIEAQLRNKNG
jgi:hypothetical protein